MMLLLAGQHCRHPGEAIADMTFKPLRKNYFELQNKKKICILYLLPTAIGLMPGGSVTQTMNNI
jgi:hypothetical protein